MEELELKISVTDIDEVKNLLAAIVDFRNAVLGDMQDACTGLIDKDHRAIVLEDVYRQWRTVERALHHLFEEKGE